MEISIGCLTLIHCFSPLEKNYDQWETKESSTIFWGKLLGIT